MAFLEASGIVKRFANHLALNDVNISVPENSIYGLLGPNGAGKTTLIRIINKITGPDEGTLMLDGKPLRSSDIMKIGYLPEERGLYKKMKVGEQAVYLARLKGLSRNDALKRLKYWFEKFEIQPWWDKKVEELSKGMAQKVQFIVTILHEPQLLIFDEPFSGFDPVNATLLKEEILELKQKGATIIFSTHNMASVEELCDHITLINNGKAMIEGRTEQIRRGYRQNLVNIEFSGQREEVEKILNDNFELRNLNSVNDHFEAQVKMTEGQSLNNVLSGIIGHCTIHSCQELLPGMNDVFIQVVNQKEQPSQNQKS
ncbi:ABC transporter ATP-binding protein [Marinilabilia salmonicolor]|jgi:ABC-2 type transport system ATP-binding protein|uniref:ABC-2 type transport system ATP-binding protein n=1 Tax=Marinilabilia salmonicolor TaxID=989 RepID=A0A368V709_9BACT|nr:ATP-binding cassette domain-containing protein [Marinilabilia salmonicolor]RCW36055.1 ABC-2 type transport system ATP-binding protein [Marinilabilia salmonicolor]